MSLLEAAIGVVLVMGIALGFGLGVPAPDARTAQLDAYAQDAMVLLAEEPPRHENASRLAELVGNEDTFDRERAALDRRIDRILPDNVMYRLETPHGAVGQPVPTRVPTGVARVTAPAGAVHLRVWYA
jgi:hypothetical protein